MTAEPTSAMTFEDLIVEVAFRLSVASYGDNGDEEAQVPTDAHDLGECKRYVNNAIRFFISLAPPNGWRWMRPLMSIYLWASFAVDDDITVTSAYEPSSGTTIITASEAKFYRTMELKTITVTDVDDYTIDTYISTTQVRVSGNVAWTGAKTFSMDPDGRYTLPRTFGGQYTGRIAYEAASNTGSTIDWTSPDNIRRLREPSTNPSGDPLWAAIRRHPTQERRWELTIYPLVNEELTVEFPYDLMFDKLVELTETHPAGFAFDEAIRAACIAVAQRDAEETVGNAMSEFTSIALPAAYRADARSAPKKLGYCGNGPAYMSQDGFRRLQRPTVNVSIDGVTQT